MGTVVAEGLIDSGAITNLADIYDLTRDELMKLPLVKEKKADKILEAIEKSKKQPFQKVLTSLGIPQVNVGGSKRLARRFSNIDAIASASVEQLLQVEDVGPKTAQEIHDWFRDGDNLRTIARLKASGVNLSAAPPAPKPASAATAAVSPAVSPIAGKSIVITGSLTRKRDEIQDEIESQWGARASGSVSKNTDILVVGENAGSKLDKARQLGITVMTEDEFYEYLKNG
jgi:DNA ligase (NAD+)